MEPADPSDFYAVHTSLRNATGALTEALGHLDPSHHRRARAIGRYWRGFTDELRAHHRVEDDVFFPALTDRVPVAVEHLGVIEEEHHVIDELLEEAGEAVGAVATSPHHRHVTSAAAALGRLDEVLRRHLAFEEADLVPLFARHFTRTEYDALGEAAVRSVPLSQALFAVPFVAAGVTPEVRDHLLRAGGLPVRAVYHLTRRRHARLAAAALGPAS